MKKQLVVVLGGIGLVLALVAIPLIGCAKPPAAPPEAKEITLVLANGYPRGHTAGATIVEAYMDRVTKMSEGKIKWDHQDAGRLLKFENALAGVRDRIADVSQPIASYIAGDMPLISITALPYVTTSIEGRTELFWKISTEQPDIKAELVKWKQLPLYAWPVDESYVHTVKKPINKLEDFKGMRIRTSGGIGDEVLKALGAIPVTIPSPETYLALKQGVIDGAVMHLSSFWGWKWYEGAKYTILQKSSFAAVCGWETINADVWAKLPRWAQDILLKAGKEHMEYMNKTFTALTADLKGKLKAGGHTFIELDPKEEERLKQAVLPVGPKWAAEHGDAGKRIWEFMKKNAK